MFPFWKRVNSHKIDLEVLFRLMGHWVITSEKHLWHFLASLYHYQKGNKINAFMSCLFNLCQFYCGRATCNVSLLSVAGSCYSWVFIEKDLIKCCIWQHKIKRSLFFAIPLKRKCRKIVLSVWKHVLIKVNYQEITKYYKGILAIAEKYFI